MYVNNNLFLKIKIHRLSKTRLNNNEKLLA